MRSRKFLPYKETKNPSSHRIACQRLHSCPHPSLTYRLPPDASQSALRIKRQTHSYAHVRSTRGICTTGTFLLRCHIQLWPLDGHPFQYLRIHNTAHFRPQTPLDAQRRRQLTFPSSWLEDVFAPPLFELERGHRKITPLWWGGREVGIPAPPLPSDEWPVVARCDSIIKVLL